MKDKECRDAEIINEDTEDNKLKNDEHNYYLYMHENMVTGKRYVGITKQNPEIRWGNGKRYEDSPHFQNAIDKYGWKNFSHTILLSGLTYEEAARKERNLIRIWCLQDDNFGYNIKDGGQGGTIPLETRKKIGEANRGRKASEETKRKLSEAHKGRKHTEEERKKISQSNKGKKRSEEWVKKRIGLLAGEKHPLYGKRMSEETCRKHSEAMKKYYSEHPFPAKADKKVMLLETGKIYESIQKAADDTNICRSSISECCSGKRKSAGGFHWKFIS